MSIKPLKETLTETYTTVKKYQTGKLKQIKTNRTWLDHQGGVTPRSIITICGASFGGKSTELESLKKDIMDTSINPNAKNFVWVSNAFEMTNFATTLRDLKNKLGTNIGEILSREFTEEEKVLAKEYYEEMTDGRFFLNQVPQTAKQFIDSIDKFLSEHQDKDLVGLDLDHIGLVRASNGDKKMSVDDVVEGLNELKNKYNNFLVVILSQLNRSILGRLKEKSNESAVRRDDLYMSDTMYFTSDYLYALQNMKFLGIEEYRRVKPSKYPHLEHRFTEEDSKGKVSLITDGCIFVEVLKDRTADIDFVDLYTIEIKPFDKKEKELSTPTIQMPVFNATKFQVNDPKDAFDDISPEDENKSPF